MSDEQQVARQQRKRNIAIALVLFGFIILLYLVTIVRLGG
jgi:predicted nucleic acid-binding Zn ribbon protein